MNMTESELKAWDLYAGMIMGSFDAESFSEAAMLAAEAADLLIAERRKRTIPPKVPRQEEINRA
jgi:hypothetical protein